MTRELTWMVPSWILVGALVWFAVDSPARIGLIALAIIAVAALCLIRGVWRKAYVLTIVAMFAGASHFGALATVGAAGKIFALVLLVAATLITSSNEPVVYANKTHKAALAGLWVTTGLAILSTLWSGNRTETALQALTLAAFVYVLHRTSTTRWVHKPAMRGDIEAAYWSSGIVLTVGAFLAAIGVSGTVDFVGRHQGLLNNPNLLGLVSAVTLAMGTGVASYRKNTLTWLSLLVPLSQVFLSQSRTAIVAVSIGLLWVILRSGIIKSIVAIYAITLFSVAAIAFRFNPFGDSLNRFNSSPGSDMLNNRTGAWSDVFAYLPSNPLGAGWATTGETMAQMGAQGLTSGLLTVHNSYLQIMFELGWFGAVPALLSVALFVFIAVRTPVGGFDRGLVAVTLTGALIQVTESTMFGMGQPYPYLFWFAVLAATVHTGHDDPKEQKNETKEPRRTNRIAKAKRKALATR